MDWRRRYIPRHTTHYVFHWLGSPASREVIQRFLSTWKNLGNRRQFSNSTYTYIHTSTIHIRKKSPTIEQKTLAATDSLRLLFLNCSFIPWFFSFFLPLSSSLGPNSYLIFNRLTRPMQPHCHFRCRQTASIHPRRPRKQNELFPIYYRGRYLPPVGWNMWAFFSFRTPALLCGMFTSSYFIWNINSQSWSDGCWWRIASA